MNKICIHGLKLERNLRCSHGYIQIILKHKGKMFCPSFGIHTKEAQEIALIKLAEMKKEILQNKIGIEPELPSKKFEEVAWLWFSIWQKEKHPDGTEAHNKESCYKVRWTIEAVLIPAFGGRKFNEISSVHIQSWRDSYTARGLSGTTPNRYQAVASSIFSHVDKWVKTERIKPAFKLPAENPCDAVEMAPSKKRERILTKYEASKLKMAFLQLNDPDGWEICKLALKSVLSMKDLKNLEIGQEIDISRSKTGVKINLPIVHLTKLNWFGWRTRWTSARVTAGLLNFQFRDLRKTGINWLRAKGHSLSHLRDYAAHANEKTTEGAYVIPQSEALEPLARDIESQVDAI